jgi:cell cycle checkpoint protein
MSWSTKYCPQSASELCPAPKKVKEVKEWLLSHAQITEGGGGKGLPITNPNTPVLVITGPTGGGKSTTVELLCKELGLKLLTWNAPTPTLWHEYLYQSGAGNTYVSKLGEFEAFLRRSTLLSPIPLLATTQTIAQEGKTPPTPSSASAAASTSISRSKIAVVGGNPKENEQKKKKKKDVILIDDLPNIHTVDQQKSLLSVLDKYCRSSRFPIVLCLSNVQKSGEQGGREKDRQSYLQDRLLLMLESVGALVVNFPPVTTTRITKVLQRISDREKVVLEKKSLTEIAEVSNGDIRNAVNSLQFSMVGYGSSEEEPNKATTATAAAGLKKRKRGKGKRQSLPLEPPAGLFSRQKLSLDLIQRDLARDRELEQFHALGKILYNKRTEDKPDFPDFSGFPERLSRNRSENKVEKVIAQAHLDSSMLLSYVHENFLRFVGEDAIEEVAEMSSYFSDSAVLMNGEESSHLSGNNSNTVAASSLVGVMGFQYANVTKPPRSFLKLRKPDLLAAEKTRIMNHFELSNACVRRASQCLYLEAMKSVVTDTLPYVRKIYQGGMNGLLQAWHDKSGTTTLIPQPHHQGNGLLDQSSWQQGPPPNTGLTTGEAGGVPAEDEDEIECVD